MTCQSTTKMTATAATPRCSAVSISNIGIIHEADNEEDRDSGSDGDSEGGTGSNSDKGISGVSSSTPLSPEDTEPKLTTVPPQCK